MALMLEKSGTMLIRGDTPLLKYFYKIPLAK
jgi:hypothetical protein